MTAPYRPGDLAAVISLEDDRVMVAESTVLRVEPDAVEGRWKIETDHGGWTIADSEGIGTFIVPIDEQVARQFVEHGSRFELEPMARHDLYREELGRDELYRDFELGRDELDGYGYGD
jgi:hypothetical protein